MSDPTDEELALLYPEVDAFAKRMRAELWANRHKGDQDSWRTMTLREAWGEISWHTGKLTGALRAEDAPLILELTADIANGAMMLADIIHVSDAVDICRCGTAAHEPSPGCAWHEQRAFYSDQLDCNCNVY